MKAVEYKFNIDEKVKTVFGDIGIVVKLGFDAGGKQYFIKRSDSSKWFKESELEKTK